MGMIGIKDMEQYGKMPTQEEYDERLEAFRYLFCDDEETREEPTMEEKKRQLAYEVYNGTDLYSIGSYSVNRDGNDQEVYYPYELCTDGAPIDGSPYDVFDTEEEAIECIKRIGGVVVYDLYREEV